MYVSISTSCEEPRLVRMKDAIQDTRRVRDGVPFENLDWNDQGVHGKVIIDHSVKHLETQNQLGRQRETP